MVLEDCKQAETTRLPDYREIDVNRRALRRGLGAERRGACAGRKHVVRADVARGPLRHMHAGLT